MILFLPSISGYPNETLWQNGWRVSLWKRIGKILILKYQKLRPRHDTAEIKEMPLEDDNYLLWKE